MCLFGFGLCGWGMEVVGWEESGMSKGEWREFEGVWG